MHSSSGLFAIDGNVLSVDVNESIYSRDAVLRTAYWFTDRCYLYIARPVMVCCECSSSKRN